MTNLSPWLKVTIYAIVVLLGYFVLLPMVNDYSCNALAESNFGSLNRIGFQFMAGCWIPWG